MSTACGRSDAPPAAPIRIGAYYWPGFYWADITHQQGWFREAGLNVEWVDTNADYFASFNDFYAGKFDVVTFTQFDFLLSWVCCMSPTRRGRHRKTPCTGAPSWLPW